MKILYLLLFLILTLTAACQHPVNVDKRREKMGLMPISDDLLRWEIDWNLEKEAEER